MLQSMRFITRSIGSACVAALAAGGVAHAEAINVSATGFTSQYREELKASSDDVWKALVQLPRWWNSSHTYSGQASNLSLDAQAGGCWCERWGDGQSVQHGTVVLAMPGRVLRVLGNLGPLQDLPVNGVLTFAITTQDGKTSLRMTYRVAGPPDAGLEKLGPVVDRVIGEQYKRLKALIETGKPE
jgi:uncharacterized protein YndB with AHSA1/START domain